MNTATGADMGKGKGMPTRSTMSGAAMTRRGDCHHCLGLAEARR